MEDSWTKFIWCVCSAVCNEGGLKSGSPTKSEWPTHKRPLKSRRHGGRHLGEAKKVDASKVKVTYGNSSVDSDDQHKSSD